MTRFRINPGEYRHKITIEQNSKIQNDYGEEIEDYSQFAEVYAGIYPISGKELFTAETAGSEVTHKINTRYIPGIKPDMRIIFQNRIFHIQSVINFQEKNVQLQLMCKEIYL